jgi:hypothetical protein
VLRTSGPARDAVTGDRRNLHNEELHKLYTSPYIIRVMKSRTMRWVGHVVRMGKIINAYKIWLGCLKGRGHSKDLGADGRIILKCILRKLK